MAGTLENSLQLGAHALAGAGASVLAMTIFYPLENIRCRLQVQRGVPKPRESAAASSQAAEDAKKEQGQPLQQQPKVLDAQPPNQYVFSGPLDCIRQVLAREGIAGLYRGLRSALLGVVISSCVYFYWYAWFKRLVAPPPPASLGPLANILVASVAGAVNVFCTIPFWVVNTRLILAKKGERGADSMRSMAAQIWREAGIAGFYRGLVPSLILVANPAIQFAVYDQLVAAQIRRNLWLGRKPYDISSHRYLVFGAVSKALATFASYPYQVIKSRQQQVEGSVAERSSWALLMQILREEGWRSLFAGMSAKLSQTVLNTALMSVIYEWFVRASFAFLRWSLRAPAASIPPKPEL